MAVIAMGWRIIVDYLEGKVPNEMAEQALTDGNTLKNAHTARSSLACTLILLPYLSL